MFNNFLKLQLVFIILLCDFIDLFSIQSEKKELKYKCILEQKEKDLELTKSILSTKVSEFLLGYVIGIEFNYSGYSIKLVTNGEISQIGKTSDVQIKYKKNATYLEESGVYQYISPNIENYKQKYSINVSKSGLDFWALYNDLIIKSIKKKVKKGSNGIVVPTGNLIVKLDQNGYIFISEIFDIYVY